MAGHSLDQQRRGLAPRSIEYRRGVLRMLREWMAPRSVLEATRADVEAFLDSRGLAAVSRRSYLSHVGRFFDWCVEEELIAANPTVRIRSPKRPASLPRPLTADELVRALDPAAFPATYAGHRLRVLVLLGAFGGLRAAEMAGLAVEDVDTAARVIHIRHGKGDKARDVPAHPAVLEALEALPLPTSGPLFMVERVGAHDTEAPGRFPVNGQPIKAHNVSHLVTDHLHRVGVAKSCHALRHAFATMIFRSTGDILLTRDLLGHASVATTQAYAACDTTKAAPAVAALSIG